MTAKAADIDVAAVNCAPAEMTNSTGNKKRSLDKRTGLLQAVLTAQYINSSKLL